MWKTRHIRLADSSVRVFVPVFNALMIGRCYPCLNCKRKSRRPDRARGTVVPITKWHASANPCQSGNFICTELDLIGNYV